MNVCNCSSAQCSCGAWAKYLSRVNIAAPFGVPEPSMCKARLVFDTPPVFYRDRFGGLHSGGQPSRLCQLKSGHSGPHQNYRRWASVPGMGDVASWSRAGEQQQKLFFDPPTARFANLVKT